jgi:predicted ATPase
VSVDLTSEFPPLKSLTRPNHNLPLQLTSFIGREQEITEIRDTLNTHRLVTLIGAGGIGKTRLAIHLAQESMPDFLDGVWLVELASISDPNFLAKAIASVFNLYDEANRPIQDTLIDFLKDKKLFLIIDNCEHLIDGCAIMADLLLHTCPQLNLLATSREALGVPGEKYYYVPSLSFVRSLTLSGLDEFLISESVLLFIDRARSIQPAFQVTSKNAIVLAKIIERLDGIPLALELAAARVNLLTIEKISDRLDNAFSLLVGNSRTELP